ncbi:DUF6286 domain-containing protein [Klenkia taihuensis]|uniref:DUF6286 domain-containing protein n=1 Tax=Klenkia taihuensis TaxID=1225127 RepID=A0A1I1HG22_9ACTN|nr:DUF6286 domain-containing protein [Klenkia taihuensis]GHE09200.1 hypothetical protein GCM10011381_13030 [Klenkia taihuensis]SFC22914.1 hypothetical protein SAMN05661030_0432 [Klenkia taihuensis]
MRGVDRVLALVLGLAGLGGGVLLAAEVVQALLGRPGHLVVPYEGAARWLREQTWSGAWVLAVGAGLAALGLLLLAAELAPRRRTLLVVATEEPDVVTAVTRGGVGRALEQAVAAVPGVDGTRSRVGRRTARLTVRTALRDSTELEAQVRERAAAALAGLGLAAAPALDVDLQRVAA